MDPAEEYGCDSIAESKFLQQHRSWIAPKMVYSAMVHRYNPLSERPPFGCSGLKYQLEESSEKHALMARFRD
jgi:hypothetical protein